MTSSLEYQVSRLKRHELVEFAELGPAEAEAVSRELTRRQVRRDAKAAAALPAPSSPTKSKKRSPIFP